MHVQLHVQACPSCKRSSAEVAPRRTAPECGAQLHMRSPVGWQHLRCRWPCGPKAIQRAGVHLVEMPCVLLLMLFQDLAACVAALVQM